MSFVLFALIIIVLLIYLSLKPLIDNIFYSVSYEPKYIHSYVPVIGFGFEIFKDPILFVRSLYLKYGKTFTIYVASKRWVYLFDEQTYLTKVLKSPDLSIDEFFNDLSVKGLNVSRECVSNDDLHDIQLKQYHKYLVGDELEVLNQRVHHSLIESMKLDAKTISNKSSKTVNFFEHFDEIMLYAGTEGLFGHSFVTEQRNSSPDYYTLYKAFDKAHQLGVFGLPFRSILYKTTFEHRGEFVKRLSTLRFHNDVSKLMQAREDLFRSDKFKDIFTDYDIPALQAAILWAAIVNTAPMSCWAIVDLFLHSEALQAVQQELKENVPSLNSIYEKETLSKLKILESCIYESVRRVLNASSIRQAMTNTTVECIDKTKVGLRKGDMLIYPAFLKHFDPNLFGPNPYEYQYDRFVKKTNQGKAPSVMLFGCGTHICPGRFWAINEIKILIALVLEHVDMDFINMTEEDKDEYRKKLPYDYSKIISSSGPKKGYEYKFDIQYSYKNLDIK